jgi:hypothetical protein
MMNKEWNDLFYKITNEKEIEEMKKLIFEKYCKDRFPLAQE